ncbi:uncharacterized protein TNCV_595711 [Trichonephila clavipes]|nr:uncharacterized protein TNCV_595711 [Trichonephila clavipes]
MFAYAYAHVLIHPKALGALQLLPNLVQQLVQSVPSDKENAGVGENKAINESLSKTNEGERLGGHGQGRLGATNLEILPLPLRSRSKQAMDKEKDRKKQEPHWGSLEKKNVIRPLNPKYTPEKLHLTKRHLSEEWRSKNTYFQFVWGCQVIYSQFGLAIHQNDHQARRRFVEWAQNEIAVVPDFHKRILFSDEAHFGLNGYVNKQNCHIWSEANPQVYVETLLHPEKLTVWCALWAGGILL